MKKLFYSVLTISILGISLIACKKNERQKENIEVVNTTDMKIITNPYPIKIKTFNEKQGLTDGERIEMNLFRISLIARDLLKNGEYNRYLIDKAKTIQNNCVSLNEFSSDKSGSSSTQHKQYFSLIDDMLLTQDMNRNTDELGNPIKAENYIQSFYIPNADKADFTKKPIICPGLEFDSELDEKYEDYIIGWIPNNSDGFDEIIFNENMMEESTNPVIILDNSNIELITKQKINLKNPPSLSSVKASEAQPAISSYEHRIYKRFDNTKHSEFCITAIGFHPNGTVYVRPLIKNNGTPTEWLKINEIHKNDVNTLIYKWSDLFTSSNSMHLMDTGLKIYYNLFERDWHRSSKPLGTINVSGQGSYYLEGKMQFEGDYYGWDPDGLIGSLNIPTILSSWANWANFSQRSDIRFWKVVN